MRMLFVVCIFCGIVAFVHALQLLINSGSFIVQRVIWHDVSRLQWQD